MFIGSKLYQRLLDAFTTCHPDNGQVGFRSCFLWSELVGLWQDLFKGNLTLLLVLISCEDLLLRRSTKRAPMSSGWPSSWARMAAVQVKIIWSRSISPWKSDWFDAGEVDLELFNAVIEDLEENALKNKQRRRREVRAGVWECGERSLLVSIKIDENFWVCAGCAWVDPDHIP